MTQPDVTLYRWKRTDYDRMVELGAFEGQPVELIGGQLIVAEPHGTYHASALAATARAVNAVVPDGWSVRVQLPVGLDDESEPEPDIAIVAGHPFDYRDAHPSRPALAIEVAESSLHLDRNYKGSVYARAGIQDYWIVNLIDRLVEVYREPEPSDAAPYGWSYRSVETFAPPSFVTSLALPSVRIAVADLLP